MSNTRENFKPETAQLHYFILNAKVLESEKKKNLPQEVLQSAIVPYIHSVSHWTSFSKESQKTSQHVDLAGVQVVGQLDRRASWL